MIGAERIISITTKKIRVGLVIGKYVAISLYSGQFDMMTLAKIIKQEPYVYYKDELDFLLENKLVELSCDTMMRLTPKGFKEYGAVATLFAGKDSQEYILNL